MELSTAANPSELSQPQVNKNKTPGSGAQRETGGVYKRSTPCIAIEKSRPWIYSAVVQIKDGRFPFS